MPTVLTLPSPRFLAELYAHREPLLAEAARRLGVTLVAREETLTLEGPAEAEARAAELFSALRDARQQGLLIRGPDFQRMVGEATAGRVAALRALFATPLVVTTPRRKIVPKTPGQKSYLAAILNHDITFGIGPAGTGKTYLAMAAAVSALQQGTVQRLVLARPAVEAGEALGFLPGDLREKILPYLRPLYDAMYDMMDRAAVDELVAKGVIEVAPLAYMRGRTLSGAFVILDEAQNTTHEQMMMFLTRLGDDARMVITGDLTQVDLPRHRGSGLREAVTLLSGIEGLAFCELAAADVVRHPLVVRILEAYERASARAESPEPAGRGPARPGT